MDSASIRSTSTINSVNPTMDRGRYPDFPMAGPKPQRPKLSPVPGMESKEFVFPRPPDPELDQLYRQLLESVDMPGTQRQSSVMDRAANIAMDTKWQIVEAAAKKKHEQDMEERRKEKSGKRLTRVDEKSPEWFLKHMMEQNMTREVVTSLAVCLRSDKTQ